MGKGRRFVALLLSALVVCLIVPSPASADDFAPEISSFKRISPDLGIPLQPVVIEFTATDQGGAGMEYALFTYRGPTGAIFRVDSQHMQRSFEGTFLATELVGLWAATGEYILEKVEIYDKESNWNTYERDTATQFDFAAADFHVDNPNQDITAPIMTSASLWQDTVKQGDPVVMLYQASDNLSGVESVTISGWTATRDQFWVQNLPGLAAVGPASWIVPLASPPGAFEVISITVIDRAGNSLSYRSGEGMSVYPEKTIIPEHSHPEPASLSFTVEGGPGDAQPPELTRLEPLSPSVVRPGDQIAMDFTARDAGTGVELVRLAWRDSVGHELEAVKQCDDVTTGPITVTLEDFRTVDRDWQLQYAAVHDRLGNWTLYHRDGRVTFSGPGFPESTHGFDLSRADFHVEAGEARAHPYADTSRRWCPLESEISLLTEDPTIVAGQPLDIAGTVEGERGSVPLPVVAVHQYVDGEPRLIDVVRGSVAGAYRSALTPTENSTVRSSFLGSLGPLGANASRSRALKVSVRPRVTARLEDSRVPLRRKAVVRGSVWPEHPGDKVILQRKTRRGWRSIRSDRLSGSGEFAFEWRTRRAGTWRVRIVKPADEDHARGFSPKRRLIFVR